MRHGLSGLIALFGWSCASFANAQDFCAEVRAIVTAARTEFVGISGEAIPQPPINMELFRGTQPLAGSRVCIAGRLSHEGRPFSASYTCSGLGEASDAGVTQLREQLDSCLGLNVWLPPEGDETTWRSQYGLIMIMIERGGDYPLSLTIASRRDENGEILGSTTRGDYLLADGTHQCVASTPEIVASYFNRYSGEPGAMQRESRDLAETQNLSPRRHVIATRATHAAHPGVIVVSWLAGGDLQIETAYAGDCRAFQELFGRVTATYVGP